MSTLYTILLHFSKVFFLINGITFVCSFNKRDLNPLLNCLTIVYLFLRDTLSGSKIPPYLTAYYLHIFIRALLFNCLCVCLIGLYLHKVSMKGT